MGIAPDEQGGLFSEKLNLLFRWNAQRNGVRLLRPYLPDGTPITTAMEEHHLRVEAQEIAAEESERRWEEDRQEESKPRSPASARSRNAARAEAQRRQEAETQARVEAQRRQEAEAELERLRAQLANRQDEDA